MKFRKLNIEDLRGAAGKFDLALPDGGIFIFGENGLGKTTIADAIELLTTGEIPAYHRQGCRLSAAIHVDAKQASVGAELFNPEMTIARGLPGDTAEPLREIDGEESHEAEIPDVPMLRHSTIRAFMDKSAGEKRKALLELLDLDSLSGFRDTLKTSANNAKDARKEAEVAHKDELGTLEGLLEGEELLDKAEELRKDAGYKSPITSEAQLAALEPESVPGEPDRHKVLGELGRASEAFGGDPVDEWNAAVADEAIRSSDALAALIEKGQLVLEDWEEDACPLCGVEQDLDQLGASLEDRAKGLAEIRERISTLKEELSKRVDATEMLSRAIGSVLALAPKDGWPSQDGLGAAKKALDEYRKGLLEARAEMKHAPAAPDLEVDLSELLPELRAAADRAQASPRAAAQNALVELRGQHRRVVDKAKKLDRARAREKAAKVVLDTADETIKSAIESALAGLSDLVERYFSTLMADPLYSDIKLTYESKQAGQVEFSIVFDGRDTPLTPPQKIMSESQLNALGLALFLARAQSDDRQPWRTLVLDDVVNSFDAPHRHGLMRLLKEDFGEWQILLLSHDSAFRDIAQHVVGDAAGWRFMEIVAWDPKGGIVLGEGDPLNRIEAALDRGEAASGLTGFARRALELGLSRPVAKLGYRVPYDPRARYTAFDFLEALRRELKDSGSDLADLEILDEIKGSVYISTLGVHYRPDLPDPTKEDLRQLIADLRKLKDGLTCDTCGKPLWHQRPAHRKCECGALKA